MQTLQYDDMSDPVADAHLRETAALFKALANPVRLAIVDALRTSPRCVHELVDVLGVAQPLVSQHLRVLRAARLLTGERRGREVVYALADHHVSHIVEDALDHAAELHVADPLASAPTDPPTTDSPTTDHPLTHPA
ncbi:MAG: winged helix-turn-helix transcriptional regulator [Acidimicrobiia bacterium]|nr:winged helix-turn-helix transcriptional regulator [Acidimicrobiia bacterium]